MDGILVINKDSGCTSRDVVNELSRFFKTRKIGHTGTLDPMATGVLIVCIGKCTRLVDMITSEYKEYVAGVKLGVLTDTLDTTGVVLKEESVSVSRDDVLRVLESFKKEYLQEVPIYSAVKINGRKLYEYARCGEEVELPKRMVNIKSIELLDFNGSEFTIRCCVSKGTYIRSLVRDIALELGTIGVMSSLVRTKQGDVDIRDSYRVSDVLSGNYRLFSVDEFFSDIKKVHIDDELFKKVSNGCSVLNSYNEDMVMFLYNNRVVAIYKDNDGILKPYKMF